MTARTKLVLASLVFAALAAWGAHELLASILAPLLKALGG